MDTFLRAAFLAGCTSSINALTAAFVPAHSPLRPALLPVVLALSFYNMQVAREIPFSKWVATYLGSFGIVNCFQLVEALLISQWSFDTQGPASNKGGLKPRPEPAPGSDEAKSIREAGAGRRIRFGYWNMLSTRYPGSRYAVKNIPKFSYRDPAWVPSVPVFLLRRCAAFAACYLILDLLDQADPEAGKEAFPIDKIAFFRRIGDVTADEVLTRVISTCMVWITGYISIELSICIPSVLGQLLGITGPSDWPPFFGQFKELYSVRQFWGVFWHQNLRRVLSSPAHFITYELLGLKRGTLLARYLAIALTFAGSGLIHVAIDYNFHLSVRQSGALLYFTEQTLGIMIEDFAQWAYQRAFGPPRGWLKTFFKLVGFVWFVLFNAWSLPLWTTQHANFASRGAQMPFSVIKMMKGGS